MNTKSCNLCHHLHPSGFCSAYRDTVPEDSRTTAHDCPAFIPAPPDEIAMRLAAPLKSGPDGHRMRDLWDAADFLANRTKRPPRREITEPGSMGDIVREALALKKV